MNEFYNTYRECAEIMGDGKVVACQQAISNGCRKCCRTGGVLLPQEELVVVPDGVVVANRMVRNCLDADGCKFNFLDKPLLCKMAPATQLLLNSSSRDLYAFYLSEEMAKNPVLQSHCDILNRIPADFRRRVLECLSILSDVGLWNMQLGTFLTKMSKEDVLEYDKLLKQMGLSE